MRLFEPEFFKIMWMILESTLLGILVALVAILYIPTLGWSYRLTKGKNWI